jgi:nicotinate-nucleotide pyrophosphorylase (carboxylating)
MEGLLDQEQLEAVLKEDVGSGDLTTQALVGPETQARAEILLKEKGILAGQIAAEQVFRFFDPKIKVLWTAPEGEWTPAGKTVAEITGKARAILTGERTALNILQHLSGIATKTRLFVEAAGNLPVRIVDTRKTLPGLRALEKYAVKVGGGHNHRFGLFDGILIKDNHLRACGGITRAVQEVRRAVSHLQKIEVEVGTLEELKEALEAKVEVVLLDNMSVAEIKKAVQFAKGRVMLEASGGVTLNTIAEIAKTGVDLISAGALTHSAKAIDLSLNLLEAW